MPVKHFTASAQDAPSHWPSRVSALADLMTHVGWSSPATAEYYLKLADAIKAGAPADLLAQESPTVAEAADLYSRYDSLKDFITAFPSQASAPQKHHLSQHFT